MSRLPKGPVAQAPSVSNCAPEPLKAKTVLTRLWTSPAVAATASRMSVTNKSVSNPEVETIYAEATTAPDTRKFALSPPYAAPERWRAEMRQIRLK